MSLSLNKGPLIIPGRTRCLKSNSNPFYPPFISSELVLREAETLHLLDGNTFLTIHDRLSLPAAGHHPSSFRLSPDSIIF